MKKIFKSILSCVMIISLCFVIPISAQENIESAKFNIEPIKHKNQLNNSAGYFHLNIKKNDVEEVEIQINNNHGTKMDYVVEFDIAKTNINGLIVYSEEAAQAPNKSLKYDITDLVTLRDEVVSVDPWSSKIVKAKIDFKDVEFDGVLLGAFTVSEKIDDSKEIGLGHVYHYELGMVLTQKESNDLPNSKLLDLGEVNMDISSGHRVLSYKILNLEPEIARHLTIQSQLIKTDDENRELFNDKVENYSIAPNGILPMELDWGKKDVESGTYKLILSADDELEQWEWTYEFTIDDEEAKDLNDKATYVLQYPTWSKIAFFILMILTIINVIILKIRRKEDVKRDNEK